MFSHDLNDEEFSNNLDENDSNLHIFEQFKEKKYENDESNRMQEKAIKDIFFKGNNSSYLTISFQDTKKFLYTQERESIYANFIQNVSIFTH